MIQRPTEQNFVLYLTGTSPPPADASATDVSDDEGERDDVHPEKSHSEGTEAERSERTEEEFFENNGSSSSTTSYSDNESVNTNFDEEDPFKWDKVRVLLQHTPTCKVMRIDLLDYSHFTQWF
jgi:cobalamin biosynthesis protein CobT